MILLAVGFALGMATAALVRVHRGVELPEARVVGEKRPADVITIHWDSK